MLERTGSSTRPAPGVRPIRRARQEGVVLIITLIVLVAMMLGALTMIRATDSTTLVAGNLAFKQSALASGDSGVEVASAWLARQTSATLWDDSVGNGYFAKVESPNAFSGQTWSAFWDSKPASDKCAVAWSDDGVASCSNNPTDDTGGNKVAFMIHRLCRYKSGDVVGGKALTGQATDPAVDCATAAAGDAGGASHRAGAQLVAVATSEAYYRITVRSTGPRNTVTFTQAVVAR